MQEDESDLSQYLKQILEFIEKAQATGPDKFFAQTANAGRVFYLALDAALTTHAVFAKMSFGPAELSSVDITHIENMGWLLDRSYLNDTYVAAVKTNFILDLWICVRENLNSQQVSENSFLSSFKVVINSIFNGSIVTDEIRIDLDAEQPIVADVGQPIDFMTLETILQLANKLQLEVATLLRKNT